MIYGVVSSLCKLIQNIFWKKSAVKAIKFLKTVIFWRTFCTFFFNEILFYFILLIFPSWKQLFFPFVKLKAYGTKCVTHIWNVKFNNIRCVANMLSGLAEYHVSFCNIVTLRFYLCEFTGMVESIVERRLVEPLMHNVLCLTMFIVLLIRKTLTLLVPTLQNGQIYSNNSTT